MVDLEAVTVDIEVLGLLLQNSAWLEVAAIKTPLFGDAAYETFHNFVDWKNAGDDFSYEHDWWGTQPAKLQKDVKEATPRISHEAMWNNLCDFVDGADVVFLQGKDFEMARFNYMQHLYKRRFPVPYYRIMCARDIAAAHSVELLQEACWCRAAYPTGDKHRASYDAAATMHTMRRVANVRQMAFAQILEDKR